MHGAIIISRVLVASAAVWRISNLFLEGRSYGGRSRFFAPGPENMLGNRVLDCLCWLSVWLSAQTAIWVAGGLAGVLLNWLLVSSLSRLVAPSDESTHGKRAMADLQPGTSSADLSRFSAECTMQANHG